MEEKMANGFDMGDGMGRRFYRGKETFYFALDADTIKPQLFGYMNKTGFGLGRDRDEKIILPDIWQFHPDYMKSKLGTENWGGQEQRDIFGVGWRTPGKSDGVALIDQPFNSW